MTHFVPVLRFIARPFIILVAGTLVVILMLVAPDSRFDRWLADWLRRRPWIWE